MNNKLGSIKEKRLSKVTDEKDNSKRDQYHIILVTIYIELSREHLCKPN